MRIPLLCLMVCSGLLAGCRVDQHRDGRNEDVKIATPFGGMSVTTNANTVGENVGLTPYPGAVLVKKDGDHDDGAADVNLSFGDFHFGVKAVTYRTSDSADKVEGFYRKDMSRYGDVILCRGDVAIGQPARTQDGLGCGDEKGSHVRVDERGRGEELKAGSRQRQHIVSIEQKDGAVEIGMIALDLPGRLRDGDAKQ